MGKFQIGDKVVIKGGGGGVVQSAPYCRLQEDGRIDREHPVYLVTDADSGNGFLALASELTLAEKWVSLTAEEEAGFRLIDFNGRPIVWQETGFRLQRKVTEVG